ncbi:MAG: alpha/beta hydrolase [Candidatus Solibacter sp.]
MVKRNGCALTIVVPGTDWHRWKETYAPDARPMQHIARTFGARAVLFDRWVGGNTKAARRQAAAELAALLAEELAADSADAGKKLNLVGFSHGGNVAALATRLLGGAVVENLVTIGTPVLAGYQPGAVGNHIHVYNPHDTTQRWGGESVTLPWAGSVGFAGRVFSTANTNIAVGIVNGRREQRHGLLLWDERTWREIEKHLKR